MFCSCMDVVHRVPKRQGENHSCKFSQSIPSLLGVIQVGWEAIVEAAAGSWFAFGVCMNWGVGEKAS